jgi:hypothetical protein
LPPDAVASRCVSRDRGEPVTDNHPGADSHTFTGNRLKRVVVDVSGDPYIDLEREAQATRAGELGRPPWRIARVGRVAAPGRGKGRPMSGEPVGQGPLQAGSPLRTPRAAAVAGIVFSVFLITALVLLRLSVPAHPGAPGAWLTDSGRRTAVVIALNLVPFAGIAFLWFIGVIRDRIGGREDRFFATVFLGSGLLFVGMLFVAAAVAGGLFAAASGTGPPNADTLTVGRNVTGILLNVYSMRMAAVFTLTTVTIARRTQIVSRWLEVAGLATALVLLVGVGVSAWLELLFPAWILALSIDILAARPVGSADVNGTAPQR